MDEPQKQIRILRLKEVMEITTLARMQIFRLAKKGLFPNPLQVTDMRLGWRSNDIDDWMNNLKPKTFSEGDNAYGKGTAKKDTT